MLAMQYSIQLPENYDSALIEQRVEKRKQLFDGHQGLVHKSFLFSDDDKLYAPFYIWKDLGEAQRFLLDDLFHGVVQAFNRVRVRSWFVVHMDYGNRDIVPTFARREVDIIPPEEKLDNFVKYEKDLQNELLSNPGLFMHVAAFDADRWEILRFSLWKDTQSAGKPTGDSHIDYRVLHITQSL
jgi:hypothetical protein